MILLLLRSGSPPRPWGPPIVVFPSEPVIRFTPTPVGTTILSVSATPLATVHPHARGDHGGGNINVRGYIGSPPRPWGPRSRANPTDPAGLVHPHARGDHGRCRTPPARRYGSPPRPWGPPLLRPPGALLVRFTPTPVGTTGTPSGSARYHSVHPHARGDHPTDSMADRTAAGSPPRPWGPPRRMSGL